MDDDENKLKTSRRKVKEDGKTFEEANTHTQNTTKPPQQQHQINHCRRLSCSADWNTKSSVSQCTIKCYWNEPQIHFKLVTKNETKSICRIDAHRMIVQFQMESCDLPRVHFSRAKKSKQQLHTATIFRSHFINFCVILLHTKITGAKTKEATKKFENNVIPW